MPNAINKIANAYLDPAKVQSAQTGLRTAFNNPDPNAPIEPAPEGDGFASIQDNRPPGGFVTDEDRARLEKLRLAAEAAKARMGAM